MKMISIPTSVQDCVSRSKIFDAQFAWKEWCFCCFC